MNKILVREMLTLNGYEVLEASTGKEAIDKVLNERPDIVLMDIHLPEMDGIEATKFIKSKKGLDDIPIVALTASAMIGDEQKILSEGFDGYVPKPIELSRLLNVVSDVLGRKDS
ncbi:MAG: response regulator [Deltaproteobacteria bacterium]|nr:response regulator [Deltaproteobacteria bacterium]